VFPVTADLTTQVIDISSSISELESCLGITIGKGIVPISEEDDFIAQLSPSIFAIAVHTLGIFMKITGGGIKVMIKLGPVALGVFWDMHKDLTNFFMGKEVFLGGESFQDEVQTALEIWQTVLNSKIPQLATALNGTKHTIEYSTASSLSYLEWAGIPTAAVLNKIQAKIVTPAVEETITYEGMDGGFMAIINVNGTNSDGNYTYHKKVFIPVSDFNLF
jgi:hypothetical protein